MDRMEDQAIQKKILQFKKTDGGRKLSGIKRPIKNDCVTRAIAMSLQDTYPNIPLEKLYYSIYTDLEERCTKYKMSKTKTKSHNPKSLYEKIKCIYQSQKWREPNRKIMKDSIRDEEFKIHSLSEPLTWSRCHQIYGNCIVESYDQKHVAWIKNGFVHDSWDSRTIPVETRDWSGSTERENLTHYAYVPPKRGIL